MAIAFVQQGGTNGSKASPTSIAASTPAGGHAVGNLVLVAVGYVGGNVNQGTLADAKGNTWTQLATSTTSGTNKAEVWGSVLTTALASGDAITFTPPASTSSKLAIDVAEFSGATILLDTGPATNPVNLNANAANNATGTLSNVTNGSLVFANMLIEEDNTSAHSALGSNWNTLTRAGSTGGSSASNINLMPAYAIANTTSYTASYQGTIRTNYSNILALQAVAPVLLPDMTMAPPVATCAPSHVATRPLTM